MTAPDSGSPLQTPPDPDRGTGSGPVSPGNGAFRALVVVALVLVSMLALREIASLIVPMLFGIFLALVAWPMVGWLERRGARHGIALGATMGVFVVVVAIIAGLLAISIAQLVAQGPRYEVRLNELVGEIKSLLAGFGVSVDSASLPGLISPGTIASLVGSAAGQVSDIAGALVVVAFTLILALLGAGGLSARARVAFGERHMLMTVTHEFGVDLRRYLVVRTQLGIFAAALTLILLVVLGIPLPFLWSFLVLAASFVPAVGVFVALIPPATLALLDNGLGAWAAVIVGFGLINFAQDYLLQPRMMGTELNMSPLVVLLSIVVWAWILGAPGALLAVPMTVGLIELFEAFPETRGLALLMRDRIEGDGMPDADASTAAAAPR